MPAFFVAFILFSAWFLCLRTPPLVISSKTTRITGPLTADGQIDYFKALEQRNYPPEMQTDDNGFRVLVRTFGRLGKDDQDWTIAQKYEKLGLDPKILPTMTIPRAPDKIVDEYFKAKGENIPNDTRTRLQNLSWTLNDYPMLADWLKESDAPLDTVAEAIRKPIFFTPLLQNPESIRSGKPQCLLALLLPDIQSLRDIARMFAARATYRVGQGNIDGAIDDKLTIIRFGRLLPTSGSLIHYLVGIAIEGVGLAVPVGANPKHPLTKEQIQRLLNGLDALPPRAPINDAYEFERYAVLDMIQTFFRSGDFRGIDTVLAKLGPLARLSNQNIIYRRTNNAFDELQGGSVRSSSVPVLPTSTEMVFRFLTPDGRALILFDALSDLLVPAFDTFEEAVRRTECAVNLQRLTLAILFYEAEHGQFSDDNCPKHIGKYLGKEPAKYFQCPSSTISDGETKYALVKYDQTNESNRNTICLVELTNSVPLDKAVIPVADVRPRQGTGSSHPGGINVGLRNGSVRFVNLAGGDEELQKMLGD